MKSNSCGWVHKEIGHRFFEWQAGYGAFSMGKSEVSIAKAYIRSQPEHHRIRTFQDEFLGLLQASGLEADESALG